MQDNASNQGPQHHSFLSEGHVRLNPAQAGWVGRELGYSRNRKLSPAHVERLAEIMSRGQWLDKSAIDFARLPGGRLILVNGHHRMAAQAKTGRDIVWNVAFHDAPDEDGVKALYYRFDTDLRIRSSANIVSGIGLCDDLSLSKGTGKALWDSASLIADGMVFQRYRPGEARPLNDDLVVICHEYAEQARAFQPMVASAPSFMRRKLQRSSTFGLAMVTLKYSPILANEFWTGLCEDDGLMKGDPRKALLTDMQTRVGASGLFAAHLMAGAKAWNAYHGGRRMQIIKVTGHSVSIDGTPFTVTV
ncbi:MAG: hypothetical protein ACK5LJ_13280 [Paracoccus sp. (in: a-proteobacteria)]